MNKLFQGLCLIIPIMVFMMTSCNNHTKFDASTRDAYFNEGWKFTKDSTVRQQELSVFDDASWEAVDLPHDWSVDPKCNPDGIFSEKSPGATSTGYVTGGTGWYRKHFRIGKSESGKTCILYFEGVYMEATVWVNGKLAGDHKYGYTPFWFDITSLLNLPGKDNVIAVKVVNEGRNTRWYSGSGIYRNVRLILIEPVHIDIWGARVITDIRSKELAAVSLEIRIKNDGDQRADTRVITKILCPEKNVKSDTALSIGLQPRHDTTITTVMDLKNPHLWSVESPFMYTAEITLEVEGKVTDRYLVPFGVRKIEVSAEKGLLLNGVPLEMKGACLHHDNGLLGAAAFNRAEERRVEIMKANGFNAIRTSHNPPSEAFLDACDRLGIIVIDETFDMWEKGKNPQDYHRFFPEWWKKDVESMILRDRNHPSIVFWSIGNEIPERADTSGARIARSLITHIETLDTTRFFTNAICAFWDHPGWDWSKSEPAFEPLTVGGYNYQWQQYQGDHKKFPSRIMMGTESVPLEAYENWQEVTNDSWVIGDFVWTGMDYLGETGIGHTQYFTPEDKDVFAMTWPWFVAWCGDIDIIGNKKPQMYYKDVIWGNSPVEINVHAPVPVGKTEKVSYWGWNDEYPCWNWSGNEDVPLQVTVYSQAPSVRLELNGRVMGEKSIGKGDKLKAVFTVPYEPGELKAVALKDGNEVAEKILKTTGTPAAIRLKADRDTIRADRNDLSYITIELVDEFGQVVTDASWQVSISLTGDGELAGSGSASPFDMTSFGKTTIKTYRGTAMAIVRPFAKKGVITLKAEAEHVKGASIDIRVM